jgi:hypothetical protein
MAGACINVKRGCGECIGMLGSLLSNSNPPVLNALERVIFNQKFKAVSSGRTNAIMQHCMHIVRFCMENRQKEMNDAFLGLELFFHNLIHIQSSSTSVLIDYYTSIVSILNSFLRNNREDPMALYLMRRQTKKLGVSLLFPKILSLNFQKKMLLVLNPTQELNGGTYDGHEDDHSTVTSTMSHGAPHQAVLSHGTLRAQARSHY